MRSAIPFTLLLALLSLLSHTTSAQYNWSAHFGPQETGFEKYWFGEWDLEVHTLRGMLDWKAYSNTEPQKLANVSKITREAIRVDLSTGLERSVHSSFTLVDRRGRQTSTVYLDPNTGKTTQREIFKYDADGRLVEWNPIKDPQSVPFASTANTLYPEALPFGRKQTFGYYDDGTLKEWTACRDNAAGEEDCAEAYIRFDPTGRIIEFVWLNVQYVITRDDSGNAVKAEMHNGVTDSTTTIAFRDEGTLVSEKYVDQGGRENIGFKDGDGKIIQYRVPSSSESLQYSITTWLYDALNRVTGIQKGFDTYEFKRNDDGLVESLTQSKATPVIERKYDKSGKLIRQKPAMMYNRFDLAETSSENISYTDGGLPDYVRVLDSEGRAIGRLHVTYSFRDEGPASLGTNR